MKIENSDSVKSQSNTDF